MAWVTASPAFLNMAADVEEIKMLAAAWFPSRLRITGFAELVGGASQ
jgi:hypothetical protein